MAYYFYKIKNYDTTKVEKLYNVDIDGLTFDNPEVYHINEVGDVIVVAHNKAEAITTWLNYIAEEDDLIPDYSGCEIGPTWEEVMEEYFENTHPDDLPFSKGVII